MENSFRDKNQENIDHQAMEIWREYQFCVHLHVEGFCVYHAGEPDHGTPIAIDPDPAQAIIKASKCLTKQQ